MPNFSYQFKKIIKRYKRVRNNMDIMRQSACLFVYQIKVDSYGYLLHNGGSGLSLNDGPDVTL